MGRPPAGPPGMRLCLSPWAGLGEGDAKPWEIGQPWASGVIGTVPSPSAGASSPSPAFVSWPPQPLPSFPLSLSPSLCLSLLWPPSPQLPLQVFTLQLSSDSIPSVSLPFPFPFSPPWGPGCPGRRNDGTRVAKPPASQPPGPVCDRQTNSHVKCRRIRFPLSSFSGPLSQQTQLLPPPHTHTACLAAPVNTQPLQRVFTG